jgi:NAD(P)-dependent dehydrogenase (short-subunit alcohol dehydrogenase family)
MSGERIAIDSFGFDGKRALVVGGATGMGAAVATLMRELGAEVMVMDHAPVSVSGVTALKVDLRDPRSIDAAVAECGGSFDAVFSCAGVPPGTPQLERINFIGHRHLIEQLLEREMLPRGSAIAMISSTAGLGWEGELPLLLEYLSTPDYEAAVKWIEAHPDRDDYRWSKQAINAYVALQAHPLLHQGIRINAVLPGPTDTPFTDVTPIALAFGQDYRVDVGIEPAAPEDQAYPLVFLCSDAARYISGATLVVDAGYVAAGLTRAYEAAAPSAAYLLGKVAQIAGHS